MNLFDALKPEEEPDIRECRIEKNHKLEEITKIYKKEILPYKYDYNPDSAYRDFFPHVPVANASAITEFCLLLIDKDLRKWEWQDKVGLYLSILINKSLDNEHLLITTHLNRTINKIGYKNIKKICVQGNTGNHTGWNMEGGELHINGEYETLSQNFNGLIYHKGELICKT